jgi:hypothetical protein
MVGGDEKAVDVEEHGLRDEIVALLFQQAGLEQEGEDIGGDEAGGLRNVLRMIEPEPAQQDVQRERGGSSIEEASVVAKLAGRELGSPEVLAQAGFVIAGIVKEHAKATGIFRREHVEHQDTTLASQGMRADVFMSRSVNGCTQSFRGHAMETATTNLPENCLPDRPVP